MTVISIEQFRQELDRYLAESTATDIILTREGKPCFMLRAICSNGANQDESLEDSATFWSMIRQRRLEKGIPWEEAKKQLDLD